jgi:hypothetical protein
MEPNSVIIADIFSKDTLEIESDQDKSGAHDDSIVLETLSAVTDV